MWLSSLPSSLTIRGRATPSAAIAEGAVPRFTPVDLGSDALSDAHVRVGAEVFCHFWPLAAVA